MQVDIVLKHRYRDDIEKKLLCKEGIKWGRVSVRL